MQKDNIKISNTTIADFPIVLWLFEQAMTLQGQNGYKVWQSLDNASLENDIQHNLQYKIVYKNEIICIFSVQLNDPLIWRNYDKNDAIYLHRIVVHPHYKGQKQFKSVLNWAKQFILRNNLKFIRMDTWADNVKLIGYYQAFGFRFIENYKTANTSELPIQNRNLNVALLELKV